MNEFLNEKLHKLKCFNNLKLLFGFTLTFCIFEVITFLDKVTCVFTVLVGFQLDIGETKSKSGLRACSCNMNITFNIIIIILLLKLSPQKIMFSSGGVIIPMFKMRGIQLNIHFF